MLDTSTRDDSTPPFGIRPGDKVLDVGCGQAPFTYATHLADSSLTDNSERMGQPIPDDGRPLYECAVDSMPFDDGEFDFLYCSQVLEHVDDPAAACRELMRVGKRGYIECPRSWVEYIFPSDEHKWLVDHEENRLVFREKTAQESGDPLGIRWYLFDWLQDEQAHAYWMSEQLQALRNVRFEWEGSFDIVVIPERDRGAGATSRKGRAAAGPAVCPPDAVEALAIRIIRGWLDRHPADASKAIAVRMVRRWLGRPLRRVRARIGGRPRR